VPRTREGAGATATSFELLELWEAVSFTPFFLRGQSVLKEVPMLTPLDAFAETGWLIDTDPRRLVHSLGPPPAELWTTLLGH